MWEILDLLSLRKGITRASCHVVEKTPFIQILFKIASRKVKDNGGRCLSIRLWIPSRISQVLWQDLRVDVNSREERGAL